MIKTILAIVEDPKRAAGFVESVLTIAHYRQAHVIFDALTAAPLMWDKLAPFGTRYTWPADLERLAGDHASAIRALLPTDARAEVISHLDEVAWIPGDVRITAPLADLLVIGPAEDWAIGWLRRRIIETLLLSSGTPLLLLWIGVQQGPR